MSVDELVQVSRRYGSDPEWVLAGGGNTSFKDETTLYIKASGFPLATIGADGFARMSRSALQKIWDARYPESQAEREAASLADLMAARVEGEEKRPSVETLMHELFPYPLVVHTHPALVNGLTCSVEGAARAKPLFGSRLLWMPAIEPGYVLATEMRRAADRHVEETGSFPRLVLLQNHGLVVAGESAAEIDGLHRDVERILRKAITRQPDMSAVAADDASVDRWRTAIETAFHDEVSTLFFTNVELMRRLESPESFAPLAGAFSPDHIVYAGTEPIFVSGAPINSAAGLRSRITSHESEHGSQPRIVAVERLGVFAVAESATACTTALALFLDEVKIAAYAESFGGERHLDQHLIEFIESWEVERYRKKIGGGGKA